MKFAVFCSSLLVSCTSLAATPINGWYSSLFGGYTHIPGNINKTRYGLTRDHANYQSGFEGGGNLGFKSNPMRYEGEITYLKANINNFKINNVKQTDVNGYNQAVFGMANIYYDFPALINPLQPFLGVGIGYGWMQAVLNSNRPSVTQFTASNSTFAYQGTGGLTYNFAENYALTLSYRYIGTTKLSAFGKMFQAHIANVGATYRFDGCNYK